MVSIAPNAMDSRTGPGQGTGRRLMLIHGLFLLLVAFTLLFTVFNLQAFKREILTEDAVARQRLLRAQYMTEVIQSAYGSPRSFRETMKREKDMLDALATGGMVTNSLQEGPQEIGPPPNQSIANEWRRKRQAVDLWEKEGEALLRLKPNDPGFDEQMLQFVLTHDSLQAPTRDMLQTYVISSQRKINFALWFVSILVLLIGGLGVFLTLKQQRADQQLIQNEQRFRQIFSSSPIGKVLVEPNGRWFDVNPAACLMLGYDHDELIGRDFRGMTHVDDYEEEFQLRQRLLKGEIDSYKVTKRYMHKSGEEIWTLASVAAVRDRDGETEYLIIQLLDITEQRRAMEALQISEVKFRNVIETATDGIILGGSDGRIVSANSATHRIFGYEDGELVGQSLEILMPQRYKPLHATAFKQVMLTGHSKLAAGHPVELEGLRKDGNEFPLEISIAVWQNEGEHFATGIIRDVSERRRAEEERQDLLRSNRDLEEFALIASHDLQEPLRKISVYSERLQTRANGNLDTQCGDYLSRILSSAQRMQTLISDLLNYSRVSSQARPFETVDLQEIIDDLVLEMDLCNLQGGSQIKVESLPVVEADAGQMRQLFQNLLENAVKYRQGGQPLRIHIYGKVDDQAGYGLPEAHRCQVMVEDNGIGFDEKYLDRIFKVFQRLHGRGQYSGTGIGLATCRRIIERHHGHITATSRPGSGSTFIITMPDKQAESEGNIEPYEVPN